MKAIYEEFMLKFGMCKHLSIISDNGLEFINRWSKTVCKLLGVKSIRTSVYKPTTNSQCERTNRPHNFRVGDKVFIKINRLKENGDGKLRQQYRGIYTINSFLSPSNVY